MFDFNYFTPTKVVFGRGAEDQVAGLIKEFGGTKILIHYGGGSVVRSGLLKRVTDTLDSAGIAYVTLGGAVPNPHLGLVYEGIELCKKENVDFLLAVGGGSAIDSAKAIGYGVANEGDVWDFYDYKRKAQGCLPVGVILTLAATGSEMSDSSVITKEDGLVKRGYSSDFSRPRFAIMDPELTMTLPDYQTACGCTDIMMHTMERYFTNGGNMEITDALAEGLLRTVKKNALILHDDPKNYDARKDRLYIHGSKGTITSEVEYNQAGELCYTVNTVGKDLVRKLNAPQNYTLETEQLGRCIENNEEPFVSPDFSVRNAKVLDMILKQIGY